ncbi:hypothetical protein ACI2OX_04040 [Bacillus sp. N9]
MHNEHSFQDHSEIHIGIIGPQALLELTRESLKSFPNFRPHFLNMNASNFDPTQLKTLMNDVNVLMFTEYHLYSMAKHRLEFNIPVHHVPLMGTGLYRSLFLGKNSYGLKYLSIDTVEIKYVEQILLELAENPIDIFVYKNHSDPLKISDIVNFHIHNYRVYDAISLTGIQEVAHQLAKQNIPYEWVTPTEQDLIVSLERALLATETRRNKEAQIVFGMINVDDFKSYVEKYTSEHDVQLLKLHIQQMLLDYMKQLDGHLINLGGEEYSFITTRGIFERETRGYKFIPYYKIRKVSLASH